MSGTVRPMLMLATLGFLTAACSDFGMDPTSPEPNLALSRLRSSPLQLRGADSSLFVGDTVRITVGVERAALGRRSITTYASADTGVAKVDPKGLVTAQRSGRTTIRVVHNGVADSYPIAVESRPGTPNTPPENNVPRDSVQDPGVLPAFNRPVLPQATVNLSVGSRSGRVLNVVAGNATSLQAALDAAQPGDDIVLPSGAIFTGNFRLPVKSGSGGAIIVRSSHLPAAERRITRADGARMARIVTPNAAPALEASPGTRGWHIAGVAFEIAAPATENYGIVRLGVGTETSIDQLPSQIVLDRVFVSGNPSGNTSRCVAFNGRSLAVVHSALVECHARGRDAQAVGGWGGPGPFLIEDNYLEASGETVMFGGADPEIAGVSPSDITIRRNHMFRPLSWRGIWTVKNIFELKHGVRVLFEDNYLANNWIDGQAGTAILFQAVSQDNRAPWTTVRDVTVRNNIIENSTGGVTILSRVAYGSNPVMPTEPSKRIAFENNLFLRVGKDPFTQGGGRPAMLLGDHQSVAFVQNTFSHDGGSSQIVFDGTPSSDLLLANNVFNSAAYGVIGSGTVEGSGTLSVFSPNARVVGNVFTGRASRLYPPSNFFPESVTPSQFKGPSASNWELADGLSFSVYGNARVGVTNSRLERARAAAIHP